MASWIKCTNTKHEAVYINLDNVVTVTRNDVADRIAERGTVISFMGGEQVYIVVSEQPECTPHTVGCDRAHGQFGLCRTACCFSQRRPISDAIWEAESSGE